MGWPKGKKRGPKQPIPDTDNPPKKKRVINKKVIWNLKSVLSASFTPIPSYNSRAKKQILPLFLRVIYCWRMQKEWLFRVSN